MLVLTAAGPHCLDAAHPDVSPASGREWIFSDAMHGLKWRRKILQFSAFFVSPLLCAGCDRGIVRMRRNWACPHCRKAPAWRFAPVLTHEDGGGRDR